MRAIIAMLGLAMAIPVFAAAATNSSAKDTGAIRGKLVMGQSGPVSIETGSGKIEIKADKESDMVLHDPRLAPLDIVLDGHMVDATHFQLDPFFRKPIHAMKDGKELLVTYYCDVCSIRYYTPGRCVCCQQETRVDLHDDSGDAGAGSGK